MISRHYRCLNDRCREVFHTFEKVPPPCPACGCVRLDWIPGGGHIAAKSPSYDRTLRHLADKYGMSDLNSPSPSRLNRAAPAVAQEQPSWQQPVNFAPGFSLPVNAQSPTCGPSAVPVHMIGKIPITPGIGGQMLPRSSSVPGPSANTVLAGRTRQRTLG